MGMSIGVSVDSRCKRVLMFVCFVLFTAGIVLIFGSLGTQQWIQATPQRRDQLTNRTTPVSVQSIMFLVVSAVRKTALRKTAKRLAMKYVHSVFKKQVSR